MNKHSDDAGETIDNSIHPLARALVKQSRTTDTANNSDTFVQWLHTLCNRDDETYTTEQHIGHLEQLAALVTGRPELFNASDTVAQLAGDRAARAYFHVLLEQYNNTTPAATDNASPAYDWYSVGICHSIWIRLHPQQRPAATFTQWIQTPGVSETWTLIETWDRDADVNVDDDIIRWFVTFYTTLHQPVSYNDTTASMLSELDTIAGTEPERVAACINAISL